MNMRLERQFLLYLLLSVCVAPGREAVGAPAAAKPDVVAIYFPGYHQDDHYDAWFGEGWNEWRLLAQAPQRFPGQQLFHPGWGDFDEADPGWMARQIALAADNGIDVFLFDWYWYSGVRFLQRPLEQGFLQATNQARLRFALMWANHDWHQYFPAPRDTDPPVLLPNRATPADFNRLIGYCITNYFGRNNYWRVQGGLYFGIFETDKFIQQLGGPAGTKKVLSQARQQVSKAGLGDIHFAAFHWLADALPRTREAGFDSATSYNISASGKAALPRQPLDRYSDLVDHHPAVWKSMDTGVLPYMPVVTIGWDCTPRWTKDTPFPPKRGAYPYGTVVVSNTPAEFARLCRLARQHVQNSGHWSPGILINAWNEWTEGSALLPERHFGTGFLDAVNRELSGPAQGR